VASPNKMTPSGRRRGAYAGILAASVLSAGALAGCSSSGHFPNPAPTPRTAKNISEANDTYETASAQIIGSRVLGTIAGNSFKKEATVLIAPVNQWDLDPKVKKGKMTTVNRHEGDSADVVVDVRRTAPNPIVKHNDISESITVRLLNTDPQSVLHNPYSIPWSAISEISVDSQFCMDPKESDSAACGLRAVTYRQDKNGNWSTESIAPIHPDFGQVSADLLAY
jgi:hypothetical protein